MDDAIWTAARIVADLLARGAYDEVVAITRGERLTADELKRAILDYGRTPTPLPDEAWALLDVVQLASASPPRFSVQVPMWTAEEGRSDLTIDLELTELAPFVYETALMDIHVL